jgi:hypothetical protein
MIGSRALEASPTPPAPSSARGQPAGLIFGPFSPSAFPRGKPPNCNSPAPSSSRNRRTHYRLEFSETDMSVVAPVVAPVKKLCAAPCLLVPHLHRPQSLFHRCFPAHDAALCQVVPHPAKSCRKHPFLYGVQEAAGSNPAGPTPAKADKEKLCGYRNTDLGNRGKVHCPNIAQKNLIP